MKWKALGVQALGPACLFFLVLNVSLWNIGAPPYRYFDEEHYVWGGQQISQSGVNDNWSHPPFAKVLIGVGMSLFDHTPLGWRVMSAVFGAAAVTAVYFWALVLFRSRRDALLVATLTALNQMHFVQSRVATLDVFMVTFMLFAFWLFTVVYLRRTNLTPRRELAVLLGASAALGCALACKWFAIVPAAICGLLFATNSRMGALKARLRVAIGHFVVLPLVIYFLVSSVLLGMRHPDYAPQLQSATTSSAPLKIASVATYEFFDLVKLQFEMLQTHINFFNPLHPYGSSWWEWPFMARPMWYYFKRWDLPDSIEIRGIFLIGNPFVFWGGFLAMLFCLWLGFRRKCEEARFIAILYFGLWLFWAVVPRKTGFFFYYYPAAMLLGFGIVQAWRQWLRPPPWVLPAGLALCFLSFVFFYPTMTSRPIDFESFEWRVFFKSWI